MTDNGSDLKLNEHLQIVIVISGEKINGFQFVVIKSFLL